MALYMQSEQYQTCYFLGKSVAYVQIPMTTFSFPFGQYQEKNITVNVATYNLGYKCFLKNYVIFLIKILQVAQKQRFFFLILILKNSLH